MGTGTDTRTAGRAHDSGHTCPWRRGIAAAEDLLAAHLAAVAARYGANGLGVIDLPALGPSQLIPAQVRAAAALFWVREVESTGLVVFVETLGTRLLRGALSLPLPQSASRIAAFVRDSERFGAPERAAICGQVLGRVEDLDRRMTEFARALSAVGRAATDRGTAHLETRAGLLAKTIGSELSARAVGLAAFAARDMVGQVRTCLSILQAPDVRMAFGNASPARILQDVAPQMLDRQVQVERHLARARAGAALIEWIAEMGPRLRASNPPISRTASVIAQAESWLLYAEGE